MLTPYDIHYNTWQKTINQRSETLVRTYLEHPERFVKGVSVVKKPPSEVWINKPKTEKIIEQKTT